jgi:prolyl-tRNA synthetase
MKDLYTFDYNTSRALVTYNEVRKVYAGLFDELKIPYLVAQADSGEMGGDLSHEFHFPTTQGEDYIISCTSSCGYVANEELAESPINGVLESGSGLGVWRGISRDRRTLINVWYPSSTPGRKCYASPEVNMHAVKTIIPDLDPSIENPSSLWAKPSAQSRRLLNLVDGRLPDSIRVKIESNDVELPYWPNAEQLPEISMETIFQNSATQQALNLLRIQDGDNCPNSDCAGNLKVEKAIELGHTFHLGTRYSDPLKATVALPAELRDGNLNSETPASTTVPSSGQEVPLQMGCHGIGVSRIIGAVADTLADNKGLNWPRVIAPFEIVVVASKGDLEDAAVEVYDTLSASSGSKPQRDVILDDRTQSFAWKMRDADLAGYPIIVVVGRAWKTKGMCEVQCRRMEISEELPLKTVPDFVDLLLDQL